MQLRDPDTTRSSAATGSHSALTSPPVPAAAGAPCAIVALADDPLLLEALGGALTGASAVTSSPSADRFIDQLVANVAGIALIDAASVASPLKSFLLTLREQFPQLLLLLIGPAHLQTELNAQIADGTIFRFVHKPASSQRLKLFIDAALRQLAAPALRPEPALAAPAAHAPTPPPASGRRGGLRLGMLCGAALTIGAAGWVLWQHYAPPAEAPEPPLPEPAPAASAPPIAPPNPASPETGTRLGSATDGEAAQAAAAQAARETAARDAAALEQAQRNVQGARAEQIGVYLQLARKRLASGALIDPADDSARTYLDSALALAPEDAEVRATSIALGEALIAQFRRAITAGDSAAAQRWFTACSDYRIASQTLNDLSAQLGKLQSQQQAPAQVAAPTTAAATTAPASTAAPAPTSTPTPSPMQAPATASGTAPGAAATDSGAPAAPAAPGTELVAESSLTRVVFVTPDYPRDAFINSVSGWVDLEYTVTAQGRVADVEVLSAEPKGMFDSAARTAIAHSRYRPVMRDGVPVAVRSRIRMRFQR
jgi:TonB family protein